MEENKILEKVSDLEHQQWMYWSKSLAENTMVQIPKERLDRWQNLWKPYSELTDDEKEQDRKWARKSINEVLEFLLNAGHFQNFGKGKNEKRYLLLPMSDFTELLYASRKDKEGEDAD